MFVIDTLQRRKRKKKLSNLRVEKKAIVGALQQNDPMLICYFHLLFIRSLCSIFYLNVRTRCSTCEDKIQIAIKSTELEFKRTAAVSDHHGSWHTSFVYRTAITITESPFDAIFLK